jgi:hypothetical protein
MAITGWREFPAFVGGRRAANAGKGRELSGGIIGPREAVPGRAVCGRGARRGAARLAPGFCGTAGADGGDEGVDRLKRFRATKRAGRLKHQSCAKNSILTFPDASCFFMSTFVG